VGTARLSLAAFWSFVAVGVIAVAAHRLLPAGARPISYALISAAPIVPLAVLVRRSGAGARLTWWLLLLAMTVLTAGSSVVALRGQSSRTLADLIVTVGHATLLAAALALVVRRGRNDVGGLLDAAIAGMGLGSVLWSGLLQPRLAAHTPLAAQIALLVSIFVLAGVLGALSRLWLVARQRLLSLLLLISALLLALVGNTALALSTGSMTANRPPLIEMFFLAAYLCVGAAALHPSIRELSQPGPVPVDRLSGGRLVFLGAALVASPVLGGGRQILGLPADGLLIAFGTLAVAPLVLLRIHRLAARRAEIEQALIHQASHDALTGLPNRAELHRRLAAALDRERAAGQPAVVLLFCDLNGFKLVNDRLGHAAGDHLLVAVAARLRAGLRSGDTVARYGGDEFIMLCEDGGAATAARLRRHVKQALSERFDLGGERVRISGSVGSVISDGVTNADELIRRADEAMYGAKHARRERVA